MTGSVTNWVHLVQKGDFAGAQPIFERYFESLVKSCRARLAGRPPGIADGEDVALSVLDTFFRRAANHRFPDLKDRDELWRLLLVIAGNKAKSLLKREGADKRGGNGVAQESVVAGPDLDEGWNLDREMGDEPTPQMELGLKETLAQLGAYMPDKQLKQIAEMRLARYQVEEIAVALDCSKATVERRLERIRDFLKGLQDGNGEKQP